MKTQLIDGLGHTAHVELPFGLSVKEMVRGLGLSAGQATVWIKQANGLWKELDRGLWAYVKPKLEGVVKFTFRQGGSTVKAIIGVVALIATIIAPFLAPLTATLLLVAVAAASIAANLLFPEEPPNLSLGGGGSQEAEAVRKLANVQSDSNPVAKGGYLPIVVGERRISPPELSDPRYSLDDSRQVVERIFAFDGQHALTDIQVDGAPISDYAAITTETIEGAGDDATSTFVNKCCKVEDVRARLAVFDLDDRDLVNQDQPSKSEPTYTRFTTVAHNDLEEIVIRLQIDSFVKSDAPSTNIRLPLRIRFREKGSNGAWNNLPEVHVTGRAQGSSLKEFRIRWDNVFGSENEPGDLGYEFWQNVPAAGDTLSSGSTGDQWQAHSHFVDGAGLKDVANIVGGRQGVRVTLDDDFAKVAYEWEIIRGYALTQSSLNGSYAYSGSVPSLFEGYLDGQVYKVKVEQTPFNGTISINHVQALVNQQPCQRPATGLIGVKSVDETIRNVTVMAARYVKDWDGSGWNTVTATSKNPATHARQILFDAMKRLGVSTDLIDNDAFVAWRQACIDNGYEVSAVFSGTPFREVLEILAAAGFARMTFSDKFSVDWFRDRSADMPVVAFTPANANISVEVVEPELPIAIRCKFQDEADDFKDAETEVNNPFVTTITGQSVREYKGITKKSLARKRAYFDLLQAVYQGRQRVSVSSATQATVCERGDLVLLVTDLIDDKAFGGVVREVLSNTTLVIDQGPTVEGSTAFFDATNVFESSNIFDEGLQSSLWIRHDQGGDEIEVSSAHLGSDGLITVRLASALSSTNVTGAHVVIGPKAQLLKRYIVLDVDREAEERASLTLVPEAPEIYEHLQRFEA
ncbi:phage tail protein [Cohaesibacter gelatinilyticus]|uniref:Putative phage tail protein n=1 Tax=Cohaesibacter gelatinilyticus TaxID=372072 RepID=A0A285PJ29_9HYPH|nr:phage tail protein [Cohaesibacter gelatinilyticus]SNZ21732.1 Putative phage tail protein [Cohaesibacter gelatinilyticus]